MAESVTYRVQPGDAGQRVDVVLARGLAVSRTRISDLCRAGAVLRGDGRPAKGSLLVAPDEVYSLPRPAVVLQGDSAEPEAIPLSIAYQDEHLLVVDKPAGMVVHPAPGHPRGTLVNALLAHLNLAPDPRLDRLRPGIVHRLDKDTSGLLVVALTFEAHNSLSDQIRTREMSRVYNCLSWGRWPKREGVLQENLGRSRVNRKKMTALREGGRTALTRYRVLESYCVAELVEARLETGRTHQIRIHFAFHGHPVVGDQEYGGRTLALRGFTGEQRGVMRRLLESIPRQALHARELAFRHPADGRRLTFASPLPGDMEYILQILREPGRREGQA